jgi:formylglycine-generating enzyme required for sulfatase activity
MEMVRVGDPGNAPDTRYDSVGFGAVDYEYFIGTYEVTYAQYMEFLNAKATVEDPHGLYHPLMEEQGNITRIGSGTAADPWLYFPIDGDLSKSQYPVNFITFWDAARFVNWMHNGQGDGDTESGAYDYLDDESLFVRDPHARYFIPTEDEWYKAAYYDPNKPGGAGYWEFPTQSDDPPTAALPPGDNTTAGSANYGTGTLTPVGAYTAKPSTTAYGTYDQGGNIWEWNETFVIDDFFGLRGGSFDNLYGLEAAHRDSYPALFENPIMGFRIAAPVPEPASMLSLLFVAVLARHVQCQRRQDSLHAS